MGERTDTRDVEAEQTAADGWHLLTLLGLYGWTISVAAAHGTREDEREADRVEGIAVVASLLGRRTITRTGLSVADVAADIYQEAISGRHHDA